MSVRVRFAFLAGLAFIAQLALPGRASTAEGGAGAAAESVQIHHDPHPTTYGPRTCLPDRPADRFVEAPYAPAQPANHDVIRVNVPASEPVWFGIGTDALVVLPPSRAPPPLS